MLYLDGTRYLLDGARMRVLIHPTRQYPRFLIFLKCMTSHQMSLIL